MFLIFKKPEYRRFNLKPRYWDPAKEEREERERRVKAELGLKDDDKTYIPNIKGQFRQEYEKRKANRNGLNSNYALRLFMILTLLFIMAFYVFVKTPDGILRFLGLGHISIIFVLSYNGTLA